MVVSRALTVVAFLCVALVINGAKPVVDKVNVGLDDENFEITAKGTIPEDAQAHKTLRVSYELNGGKVSAQQNFLMLSHPETGLDTFYVFHSTGSGYEVVVDVVAEAETLMYNSGSYSARILIGGGSVEVPVDFAVGTFDLSLPSAPPTPELPLYHRPLLHDSDTTLEALPEIHHIFRPAQPDPSPFLPYLFSGFVIFAVLALQAGFQMVKAAAPANAVSPSVTMAGLAFVVCLTAVLGLFTIYWLQLSAAHMLTTLCPLALVTVVTGHQCLRGLASARLSAEEVHGGANNKTKSE